MAKGSSILKEFIKSQIKARSIKKVLTPTTVYELKRLVNLFPVDSSEDLVIDIFLVYHRLNNLLK